MRYRTGSLVISRERDIPLLRQVRNSKFVTHAQLFEFMKLGGFDHDRDSFNWRVRRLKRWGHIGVCSLVHGEGSDVYRITKAGISLLEHYGQYISVLNSNSEHLPLLSQAFHAIELNAVQLALARNNLVACWQSEIEVAAFNTVSQSPFQKDYDAIVDVWLNDRRARFALEYERSLKNTRHYKRIHFALEAEREVDCILYLVAGVELLVPLIQEFGSVKKKLAFAYANCFENDLLETSVLIGSGSATVKFRELLQ
jgi:hypothetical protein